jgi:tetratricopeptide (TPR) repeat protein
MVLAMRMEMIAWVMALALASTVMRAEETAGAAEVPAVEAAIPEVVKALPAPAMQAFPNGIRMAVSSTSTEAQEHVLQGLNHLHGGWEFEASRHFAAALRADPDCLLAHWGMVMALLNPTPETGPARNAASDRLLSLIEAGKGTELERGYAYGLVKYFDEGPAGAATAFRRVAERFPNEMQASVFTALFNRGGYDAAGDPTADQDAAEKRLFALMEKHPDSTVPLNALLTVRAEAPDLSKSLELARNLCRMAPDYAPYFHLLGHYEWRCGHHGEAAAAFGKAAGFYQKWMRENKAGIADCPEWIRAETYRIVALVSRGEFETGYAAARQLAATPVPDGRPASPGARFLLWDAKTLPARVLLHRGFKGNAQEASASLPRPDEVKPLHRHSLAYWWIDGLRIALEAQRLLDVGKVDDARDAVAALTRHGEGMARIQGQASSGGERSAWLRSFRALEVLASDLRGKVAMAGPEDLRGTAFNWFSSAADRQLPSPLLLPPMILTPMAVRLGEFRLATGKPAEAVEAYQRALRTFPNDISALDGLARAHSAAGDSAKADETKALIGELKAH